MDIRLSSLLDGSGFTVTESLQEKVAQRLFVRFNTHVNTWMLNLDYGVDWFGRVFGKGRSRAAVDALMTETILAEPYVTSVVSFSSKLVGRTYSLTFSVTTPDVAEEPISFSMLLNEDGVTLTNENGIPLAV